jgi:hypothetical protein
LSTRLRVGLPSGLFPSGVTTKILYSVLLFPVQPTCSPRLALLELIIPIIRVFGEECKLRSSSLCSFLRSPVTSSLFRSNDLLSTCSQTLSVYVPLWMSETKIRTYTEPQAKL